jgi:hypothetical protein
MTDTADHERSTDANQYDPDAAGAIAARRLAEEVDPARFGKARDVSEKLAELAADLRGGEVTVRSLDAACVELELLYNHLEEVSRLHGWGWENHPDDHAQPEPDTEPDAEVPDGLGDPTPPEFPPTDE